jgi:hypothetical protein
MAILKIDNTYTTTYTTSMDPISIFLEEHPTLSITQFAKNAGVGYSVAHRTRQLLFEEMPPSIERYMRSIDNDIDWAKIYERARNSQLQRFQHDYSCLLRRHDMEQWQHILISVPASIDDIDYRRLWKESFLTRYSNWIDFRRSIAESQMDFARMFLINPAIVQHFESRRTKELPQIIKERFELLGVPGWKISFLASLPVSHSPKSSSGKKPNHGSSSTTGLL